MSSSPHYDRALRADLPTAIRLVRESQARLPLGDPTSTDLRFVTFEMTVAGLLAKLDGVTEIQKQRPLSLGTELLFAVAEVLDEKGSAETLARLDEVYKRALRAFHGEVGP